MGNYRDEYAVRGIHDCLYSKAIVVENEAGEKIVLVSVDACVLDRNNVAFMREQIVRPRPK